MTSGREDALPHLYPASGFFREFLWKARNDRLMGADAPIPPIVMDGRRPEGRPAAALRTYHFYVPVIALPCPARGPEAGSPPIIRTFLDFHYPCAIQPVRGRFPGPGFPSSYFSLHRASCSTVTYAPAPWPGPRCGAPRGRATARMPGCLFSGMHCVPRRPRPRQRPPRPG